MTNIENQTPLEMFYHWETTCPAQVFLRQAVAGRWQELTWAEVADRVRRTAAFLAARNLPPGSRIAIYAANCADWVIVDLAIMMSGHLSVPLYPGQDAEAVRYILDHSDSQLIFIGAFDLASRADAVLPTGLPRVAIHGCTVAAEHSLAAILASHSPLTASPRPDPAATFSLLYTSGTSGNPKGVMHAHGTPGRVMARMHGVWGIGRGAERERMISYLPLSHAAERAIIEMNALYSNATISFSAGPAHFADELREVRPTFFFSVPRLWSKFKQAVDAKFPAEVQRHWGEAEKAAVRTQLGLDRARVILTGSAPCPADIHHWYLDLGIELREGYSMTENFCDGAFWLAPGRPLPGCCGQPLPGVEVKLAADDEICFRSTGLMTGYYREPEKTAEVLRDGWYHTGDSGRIDSHGLWVTGRLSEVFKTTKGKFIKPTRLEALFTGTPLLQQVCVFGHGRHQPALAATLSPEALSMTEADLVTAITQLLANTNASLPPYERIDTAYLCRSEWTTAAGLLTPTLKIKRRAVEAHVLRQAPADGEAVVMID